LANGLRAKYDHAFCYHFACGYFALTTVELRSFHRGPMTHKAENSPSNPLHKKFANFWFQQVSWKYFICT
jgi:hypothetical protein